jgi:hypothetical protein
VGCILSPLRGWLMLSSVWEQVAGGEEGLAEVAGDDFFRAADSGEVDARVPAEKYIDVRRYMFEIGGR